MFKTIVAGLAAAAAVHAQNISLIPAGISSDCNTALSALNSDAQISSCIQPLINATASFSPLSTVNLSSSDIDWSLAAICRGSAGCSDASIRSWLSRVQAACGAELTGASPNAQVRELYDILYIVNPLKSAVCSIDSANQAYCVNQLRAASSAPAANVTATGTGNATASANGTATNGTSNSTANALFASYAVDLPAPVVFAAENLYIIINSAADLARRMLSQRQDAPGGARTSTNIPTVITPNVTTYRNTNLPFLFLQPSYPSAQLCTPCTREIMVAYIKWETQVPYALGLAQSPTLGGQIELWNAITGTCGANYVNAINAQVQQSTGSGNSSSAAGRNVVLGVQGMGAGAGAAVLAAVMGGFALLL